MGHVPCIVEKSLHWKYSRSSKRTPRGPNFAGSQPLITAIDTSVILTIFGREPGFEAWERSLREAATVGRLCVCPVVFAELAPGSESAAHLTHLLDILAIDYEEFSPDSAHLAGCIHREYRREGGPREHLVPDFLVAAHAQVQCDRLAAIDRGYLRRYFSELPLLSPR